MSFQAMTWAVEQLLPAREKLVLLMLANRTNHDTGFCFPSHDRLAEECGMSKTTVKEAIKSLAERGTLRIVPRFSEGVSLPNQYVLNIQGAGRQPTPDGEAAAEGVGRNPTGGGAPADYKPGSQPKKKKELRVREVFAPPNGDIRLDVDADLMDAWVKAFPALNVVNQIERAELWLNANPANRKSNYERFLLNWLTRAQDSAPRVNQQAPAPRMSGGRRPVHSSWTDHFQRQPMKETGDVFDVVATPVGG